MKTPEIETALQILSGYPVVHSEIASRILAYAENKNLILDGRVGFLLFPEALRNYYFHTFPEKRAQNAARSRSLLLEDARAYITFRDAFEIPYEIPNRVRTVSLDSFRTVNEIILYLKQDIAPVL